MRSWLRLNVPSSVGGFVRDKLDLRAQVLTAQEEGGQATASATVENELVAEAELGFAFTRVRSPKILEARRDALNIWLSGSAEEI
jgi:hypothetical protein